MIHDRTPESRTPARSVFRLDLPDAIDALTAYVNLRGITVPKGSRFVWVNRDHGASREWIVALVVDEEPTPQEPAGEHTEDTR